MDTQFYSILSLIMRYWFIILGGYIVIRLLVTPNQEIYKVTNRNFVKSGVLVVLMVLILSAFGVLAFNKQPSFNMAILFIGIDLAAIILIQQIIYGMLVKGSEPFCLLIMNMLASIGCIMLCRLDFNIALKQLTWLLFGNIAMLMGTIIVSFTRISKGFMCSLFFVSISILALPFFIGEKVSGAYNWVKIGSYTFQPSEVVKVFLVFMMASFFENKKSFKESITAFVGISLLVGMVVLQRDLGAALIYFCTFLSLYYIATTNILMVALSIVFGSIGALVSYQFFHHIQVRIIAWKDPFKGQIEYNEGYQIAQSLIAISAGGLFGTGLGLGMPDKIPVAETDFIFSAICEEMGLVFGIFIILLFMLIVQRVGGIAKQVKNRYDLLILMGASISLTAQAVIILGGVTKFIPLTGVTLPFVSYGGTSMVVSCLFMGMIQGIAVKNQRIKKIEQKKQLDQENDKESPV